MRRSNRRSCKATVEKINQPSSDGNHDKSIFPRFQATEICNRAFLQRGAGKSYAWYLVQLGKPDWLTDAALEKSILALRAGGDASPRPVGSSDGR